MKEYEELLKEFGMERKPESEKEEKKAGLSLCHKN